MRQSASGSRATRKLSFFNPKTSHFGRDGKANVDAFESMSSGDDGGDVFGIAKGFDRKRLLATVKSSRVTYSALGTCYDKFDFPNDLTSLSRGRAPTGDVDARSTSL